MTRTITVMKKDGTTKSVESPYTDEEIMERLTQLTGHVVLDRTIGALTQAHPDAPLARSSFACDLAKKGYRYGLSEKQRAWAHVLVVERETPRPDPPATLRLPRIRKMMDDVAEELQFPKINLETKKGTRLRLARSGSRSRVPGTINITDGRAYGEATYFGKIDLAGGLIASNSMTDEVLDFLAAFDVEPVAVDLTAYGKRTGSCCFCASPLEDGRSVAVGYGPICGPRYGLPWGDSTVSSTVTVAEVTS
tara:strand:+ start:2245 stop:2994 length:750 start_codon:yes stop_codon:yes gene_type:complete